ncbi:MAG: BlaI/MecI/CopY family transcriptional regulator [Bdellovibrionota bacterium]
MKKSKAPGKVAEKLLTEVELELMNILWRLGEGSVNDVIELLPKERDLAYTSVSTILRILEQKEIVTTRKEGRGHVYVPAIQKSEYEAKTVRHVVEKVFDGTPMALVKQLLSSVKMGDDELAELKKLVADMGKKR